LIPCCLHIALGRLNSAIVSIEDISRGFDHPKVAIYSQTLSGGRKAGTRVTVMGAGGIGFDVAEFLVTAPVETEQSAVFFSMWGVDADFARPGALDDDPQAPVPAARAVTVLQRKPSKLDWPHGLLYDQFVNLAHGGFRSIQEKNFGTDTVRPDREGTGFQAR